MEKCLHALNEFRPDAVILIDYPSFNLRVAKYVKQHLKTPVFYYIFLKFGHGKRFVSKPLNAISAECLPFCPLKLIYARYDFRQRMSVILLRNP